MAKDLLCKAGGTGSIPGWGAKTPRAVEHLGPLAATAEATDRSWSGGACSARSACCSAGQ